MSNCTERIVKTGGSIKIIGTCPSRIVATFFNEGKQPLMINIITYSLLKFIRKCVMCLSSYQPHELENVYLLQY